MHFWTDDEREKFWLNGPKETFTNTTKEVISEALEITPVEEALQKLTAAIMKHDEKWSPSYHQVDEMWNWINSYCTIEGRPVHQIDSPIVHESRFDHEILKDISTNWPKQLVEVQDPKGSSGVCTAEPSEVHEDTMQLFPDQARLFDAVCTTQEQTLTFIIAGGGVGKTVMINAMSRHFGNAQMNFAFTGVAASLMPQGLTLSSIFSNTWQNPGKKAELTAIFGNIAHVVIDEISMCPLSMLMRVNKVLQHVKRTSKFFGGIKVTLVGDMLQLPAVKATNIYDDHQYELGVMSLLNAFQYYTDSDFDSNKRSNGCADLKELQTALRTLPRFSLGTLGDRSNKKKEWSKEEVQNYHLLSRKQASNVLKELSEADLHNGFTTPPCFFFHRTNRARAAFTHHYLRQLGKHMGQPVLAYRRPLQKHTLQNHCEDFLYDIERFPELFGFFVKGASATILHNVSVPLGLVNGEQIPKPFFYQNMLPKNCNGTSCTIPKKTLMYLSNRTCPLFINFLFYG
jgi:hypothetical protein